MTGFVNMFFSQVFCLMVCAMSDVVDVQVFTLKGLCNTYLMVYIASLSVCVTVINGLEFTVFFKHFHLCQIYQIKW